MAILCLDCMLQERESLKIKTICNVSEEIKELHDSFNLFIVLVGEELKCQTDFILVSIKLLLESQAKKSIFKWS